MVRLEIAENTYTDYVEMSKPWIITNTLENDANERIIYTRTFQCSTYVVLQLNNENFILALQMVILMPL